MQQPHRSASATPVSLQPGDFFHPEFQKCGFSPSRVVRAMKHVSLGAKLVYAALADRAHRNGYCWPAYSTIGEDTGLSRRRVMEYVKELRGLGLIAVQSRESGDGDSDTNIYRFIATPELISAADGVVLKARQGGADSNTRVVPKMTPKEVNVINKGKDADVDQMPKHHASRDASASSAGTAATRIEHALRSYMQADPPPRIVAAIKAAAQEYDASEDQVAAILTELHQSGYSPERKSGPRAWSWFPTVVRDRLQQRRAQAASYAQQGAHHWVPCQPTLEMPLSDLFHAAMEIDSSAWHQ